jgi:heptosyltransferase-2
MHKTLIIAPSWVGDTVLAQPLFRRLREDHPAMTLHVLAPAWTQDLLQRMPEVDKVLLNPFKHGELKLWQRYRLGRRLKREHYTHAIVLPNSYKSALIPLFAGIPVRIGYVGEKRYGLLNQARSLDEKKVALMAERFLALAEKPPTGIRQPIPHPVLHVEAAQKRATLQKLGLVIDKPVAACCVGAEYGPAKRWPAGYYAKLAQQLVARGFQVWLLGSPNDREVGEDIQRACSDICRNLCGKTNLSEAIDLLACTELVVTNDSGLMHIAAALGKPLFALYGSSSPGFTPPLSDHAHIIKLDLPCSPCFQRVCPLGHFNCMMQLTPDLVISRILEN